MEFMLWSYLLEVEPVEEESKGTLGLDTKFSEVLHVFQLSNKNNNEEDWREKQRNEDPTTTQLMENVNSKRWKGKRKQWRLIETTDNITG